MAKKPTTPSVTTRRPGTKPAPLGTAPKPPRRGTAKPAPLGTAPAKPKDRMTPQDKAMLNILKKKYGANVYKG